MKLNDLFRQAKEIRGSLEQQVDQFETERNKLRAELREHETRPRPQADLAQEAGELVDVLVARAKAGFAPGIEKTFASYANGDQTRVADKINHPEFTLFRGAGIETLLYLVAGPQIKTAVIEAVNAMPYSEQVGLPPAEREAVCTDLQARIKKLDDQIRELIEQADEVGISF
ncbi:hypothetical protein [uncultured Thiocystis sp.]|jgi:hypothetical protein|uniref:hypothetical protein n=1 Tax=uncultured Thiocystis sp. TaxID=1202134 RepID=UPI0025EE4046|nr:hypothetical protein [uncultured Thiocystis sp.]